MTKGNAMEAGYEIYRARRGLLRRRQIAWRFRSSNGRVIARSTEGYNNLADCEASIRLLKRSLTAEVRYLDGLKPSRSR